MNSEQLRRAIASHIEDAAVTVTGGDGKFEVTVVSEAFDGLSTVDRHRLVYEAVNREIETGTVHALSIRARTQEENRGGSHSPRTRSGQAPET